MRKGNTYSEIQRRPTSDLSSHSYVYYIGPTALHEETDLVNHHSRRNLAVDVLGELGSFLLGSGLLLVDMRLQATVEIVHADARDDNRDDNQNQGNDGKECHRGTSRQVLGERRRSVHAEEFEAEIPQGRE